MLSARTVHRQTSCNFEATGSIRWGATAQGQTSMCLMQTGCIPNMPLNFRSLINTSLFNIAGRFGPGSGPALPFKTKDPAKCV